MNTVKVNDIRPDDVMAGQALAVRDDIEWLAARRGRFVAVACPACGESSGAFLYEKCDLRHERCPGCATQYVNPRPDADLLREFYVRSTNYAYWAKHVFPASAEARRERIFKPRADQVARVLAGREKAGGVLLEVGAAYGFFCEEMRARGLFDRIVAIEPTPDLAGICREKGFETIERSYDRTTPDFAADVIAAFEVIEHLFDPGRFVAWCAAHLVPGGRVIITCPNIAGFEPMMLGREASAVDNEHLNLFTPDSITRLFVRHGFTVDEVTTPGVLDADLVRRGLESGAVDAAALGPFVQACLDERRMEAFQAFVTSSGLSGNMMVVARKPA